MTSSDSRPVADAAWPRLLLGALTQAEPVALTPSNAPAWNLQATKSQIKPQRRYHCGLHRHEYMEICLAVQGQSILEIDDRRYRMVEPAMVALNPGVLHCEAFDRQRHPYATMWISWQNRNVHAFANTYDPDSGWSCPWTTSLPPQHQQRLTKWHAGVFDAAAFELMRTALLAPIGELAYRALTQQARGNVASGHMRVLRWVRRYLDQHYAEPLSVDQVAAMTCYSPNYLNSLFCRWTGHGIRAYIINRRMHHAMTLCRDTDKPIQKIAAQVGYDDPLYFSRAFQRYHGQPPTAARERRS